MSAEQWLAVYIRGDKAYVVSQAGTAGLRVEVEPVLVVPAETHHLAKALEEASQQPPQPPVVPNLRNYKSPVLAAAGVSSQSKFERTARYFTVRRSHAGVQVQKFRRGPSQKGFEAEGEPVQLSTADPMGAAAEEILRKV